VAREGRYNIPAKYINHGYRGFDCSGLLDWAFSQMGINIGRTTYQQVNAGRAVSLNNIRPGDLLFFKGPVHVGLYVGNGKWLVAPESHAYVRIENVPWNKIACARRVLP
ncbi:MAG: C40 family peptidase, partial [Romboutsia sp.]|uniref:C40 family peptidase n=1 Tax=Romboutsia sp. TaxID=1965302 RepID=UPI003F2E60FC